MILNFIEYYGQHSIVSLQNCPVKSNYFQPKQNNSKSHRDYEFWYYSITFCSSSAILISSSVGHVCSSFSGSGIISDSRDSCLEGSHLCKTVITLFSSLKKNKLEWQSTHGIFLGFQTSWSLDDSKLDKDRIHKE